MTGRTKMWRRLLLMLCAVTALVFAACMFTALTTGSYISGIALAPTRQPFVERVIDAPVKTGLKPGDLIDFGKMSADDRWRWTGAMRGASIAFDALRDGRPVRIVLKPGPSSYFGMSYLSSGAWPWWVSNAGTLWMVAFAAVLAWRRAESSEARSLALFLLCTQLGSLLWDFRVGPPVVAALMYITGGAVNALGGAMIVVHAMLFKPASRIRNALAFIAYLSWACVWLYSTAAVVGSWTLSLDPNGAAMSGIVAGIVVGLLPWLLTPLCTVFAVVETTGAQRTRLLWTSASLAAYFALYLTSGILLTVGGSSSLVATNIANVAQFVAPLGLTYALLNRRLLDVGFALNRAAVYTVVSIVIVGFFVLAEWALSEWLRDASHTTNLAVSAALALLLGLSVRFVHARVDRILDTVFFRKRHEDERAIRTLAHEVAYITDPATILQRTIATLERHADASFVALALDDGHGHYGDTGENDPAIVALRAWRKTLDLHTVETQLAGDFAYPMIARGRLVGALVLGPKRSGDSYAPDESDAIAQLAQGVAGALDVLSLHGDDLRDSLLDAIANLSDKISAGFERLASSEQTGVQR